MRKKIADKESAVVFVKEINERANRVAEEMKVLAAQLIELKSFIQDDSKHYENFSNNVRMRNAASELIRHERKLAQILPTLKVLAFSRYPEPIIREEAEEDEPGAQELPNKIDKKAKPFKLVVPPKEELSEVPKDEK